MPWIALLRGAFIAIGLATPAAGAQDTVSAAEKLLFQTDHLKNVAPPATLSYAFRKAGSEETGFDDTVGLRVRALDGAKQASVTFLSAERRTAEQRPRAAAPRVHECASFTWRQRGCIPNSASYP